jgi:ATP-dependent Clp protease protease subunit
MKPQEVKSVDDGLNQISAKAAEYYNAMVAASKAGSPLEDYVDLAGMNALKKITGFAGKTDEKPEGANIVPTVTEIDERGVARGYDLFSLLMKQRIVLLEGGVDETMASIACASLLYLNSDASGSPKDEIKVHINSPGGSVIAGQAIYDVMRSIEAPVTTIGVGMQASMGSILLAAGDKRMMTRGSKLMIHSIGSQTQGKLAEQEIDLEVSRRLFEEMKAVYVRHIGLTPEFWDLTCARDTWFTADQALKMGFIHEVITGDRKPAPYEKAASDFLAASADKRNAEIPTTVEGIKDLLLGTSADGGKAERLRPECIVALSQMPKYWTAAKKAEAKAAANDNKAAPKKAAGNGPSL